MNFLDMKIYKHIQWSKAPETVTGATAATEASASAVDQFIGQARRKTEHR